MVEGLDNHFHAEATKETDMETRVEHLNVTVADPLALASFLCRVFDWSIRWQGSAIHGGHTVHVGGKDSYLAIYGGRPGVKFTEPSDCYSTRTGLNHIGFVVGNIGETESRVKAEGFTPHSHADYEPGRRFYFDGPEELEIEIVCYQ
jgi:catechol 2,3-dioxygenase-like lactoylglutathione lyase family enzyme